MFVSCDGMSTNTNWVIRIDVQDTSGIGMHSHYNLQIKVRH